MRFMDLQPGDIFTVDHLPKMIKLFQPVHPVGYTNLKANAVAFSGGIWYWDEEDDVILIQEFKSE